MGFVEYHGFVIGDDAGKVVLFDSEIGEEQVVVDDDDVRRQRPALHFRDEAAFELGALLAGAELAAGVHLGPGRGGFRERLDLGPVTGFGVLFPLADDLEIGNLFEPGEDRLPLGVVDLLAAGVVGPALHVGDAQLVGEVLLQERNVFEEQLFLQVLGAGGDDDALAGENGGDQIGERFTGARAGFDQQVLAFVDSRFDGLGHFQLAGAELVVRMPFGESSAGREKTTRAHGAGFRRHPLSSLLAPG